ncbi:MAG: hypothetical protein ACRC2J_00290 [Microcoleaceae cyanobacterium]
MEKNLSEKLIDLMSDGQWHNADELIEKISHRFSANMHTLKKRGYQFEKRKIDAHCYEYRLLVNVTAS